MFNYTCSVCEAEFTTEVPWNREETEICFPCALDEHEKEDE